MRDDPSWFTTPSPSVGNRRTSYMKYNDMSEHPTLPLTRERKKALTKWNHHLKRDGPSFELYTRVARQLGITMDEDKLQVTYFEQTGPYIFFDRQDDKVRALFDQHTAIVKANRAKAGTDGALASGSIEPMPTGDPPKRPVEVQALKDALGYFGLDRLEVLCADVDQLHEAVAALEDAEEAAAIGDYAAMADYDIVVRDAFNAADPMHDASVAELASFTQSLKPKVEPIASVEVPTAIKKLRAQLEEYGMESMLAWAGDGELLATAFDTVKRATDFLPLYPERAAGAYKEAERMANDARPMMRAPTVPKLKVEPTPFTSVPDAPPAAVSDAEDMGLLARVRALGPPPTGSPPEPPGNWPVPPPAPPPPSPSDLNNRDFPVPPAKPPAKPKADDDEEEPWKAARAPYTIGVFLTKQQYGAVERMLPSKRIVMPPGVPQKHHPVTRVINEYVNQQAYKKARSIAADKLVLDIGGDPTWHSTAGNTNVHCCLPLAEAEDVHREARYKRNVTPGVTHCNHPGQTCPCIDPDRVGAILMTNVVYYFNPNAVVTLVNKYKVPMLFTCHKLSEPEGTAFNSEVTWASTLVGDERFVRMRVEPDNEYFHSALDWLNARQHRFGSLAAHWTLDFKIDTLSLYEARAITPGRIDGADASRQYSIAELASPQHYHPGPVVLRPLAISYGIDTATVSPHLQPVNFHKLKFYSLGPILGIAAPDAQTSVLLPKAAVGEVALKMAGKVRNTDAQVAAYAYAKAALNRCNIDALRLSQMVPYVAMMGLYHTVYDEMYATAAHEEHKLVAAYNESLDNPRLGLFHRVWAWARRFAGQYTPQQKWWAAAAALGTMYAAYRACRILLATLLRTALGNRFVLWRMREACKTLPYVGPMLERLIGARDIIALRNWAGCPKSRVQDAIFLGYVATQSTVAKAVAGTASSALATWLTILAKPTLRRLGQWLKDRFAVDLVVTAMKRLVPIPLSILFPSGVVTTFFATCLVAPVGEEFFKRVCTYWTTWWWHDWTGILARAFSSMDRQGWKTTLVDAANYHLLHRAPWQCNIFKLTDPQCYVNVLHGAIFAHFESFMYRDNLAARVHRALLHMSFALWPEIDISIALHFFNNFQWFIVTYILGIVSGIPMARPPALIIGGVDTMGINLDPGLPNVPGTPPSRTRVFVQAGLEEVGRRAVAIIFEAVLNLVAPRLDTFVPPSIVADLLAASFHTALETKTWDKWVLYRLLAHWSLNAWSLPWAITAHSLHNCVAIYSGAPQLSLQSWRAEATSTLTNPKFMVALEEIARRGFSRGIMALVAMALGYQFSPHVGDAAAATVQAAYESNSLVSWHFVYRAVAHYVLNRLPIYVALPAHYAHNYLVAKAQGPPIERNDVCWWPLLDMHKIDSFLAEYPRCSFRVADPVDLCKPRLAGRLLGPSALVAQPVVSRQCVTNHIVAIQQRLMTPQIVEGGNGPLRKAPPAVQAHYALIMKFIDDKHKYILTPKRIVPTPFLQWVSRFPAAKAKRLLDIYNKHEPITHEDRKIGLFTKVESIICAFCIIMDFFFTITPIVAEKAPRPICGISDKESVETGPWTHAWFTEIKRQYGFQGPYCHSSGMNAAKLGAWFTYHVDRLRASHGSVCAVEIDCSVWDGHMNCINQEIEHEGQRRYWQPPPRVRWYHQRNGELVIKTKTGVTAKLEGPVGSGRSDTSAKNGEFNIDNFGAMVQRIIPDIRDHIKHLAYTVNGDDSLALVSPWLYDRLREFDVIGWFNKCNHEAKVVWHKDHRFASFCSGYFYPTIDGDTPVHVWGMKPGRAFSKNMWRLSPSAAGYQRDDFDWLRGMAIQYNHDCSHIPVLRALRVWLARRVAQMEATGKYDKRRPIFETVQRPRSPKAYPCTSDTLVFMQELYGTLDVTDILSVERQILECSGPTLLDSWAIREIVRVDVGYKVPSLDVITNEWTGVYSHDPTGRPVAVRPVQLEHPLWILQSFASLPLLSVLDSFCSPVPLMSNAAPKSKQPAKKQSQQTERRIANVERRVVNAATAAAVRSATRAVATTRPPPRAPRSKGGAKGSAKRSGTGRAGDSFEAQVRDLIYRLAFPDLCDPVCLGMTACARTTAHKLFATFSVPWSSATAQIAGQMPVNQTFVAVCTKHPSVGMVYPEWKTNSTVTRAFSNDGSPIIRFTRGTWIQCDSLTVNQPGPNGNTREVTYNNNDVAPEETGAFMWVDFAGTASTLTITLNTGTWTNATVYSLNFIRRVDSFYGAGTVTATGTGGAGLTFTLPAVSGYYMFQLDIATVWTAPSNPSWTDGTAILASIAPVAGGVVMRHDPLPSNIAVTLDSIRINAARATMTNFSAPLAAEGAAVAYECPSSDRWDSYIFSTGAWGDPFSTLSGQQGREIRVAAEGLSIAAHPNINKEPTDTSTITSLTGIANSTMAPVSFDAVCGASILCVRTGLANADARDGLWQIYYHTEGETGSQLFTQRPADYSPLVILEAEARFRNFRTISGNPNHFKKGMAAIGQIMNKADRIGNAMIATGIGAPMGGALKGVVAASKHFYNAIN